MNTDREKVRLIFGLKLKQLRADQGLSTYDLADLTGLSPSYLNEIEKGKKYPKSEKIFAIAKALGTDYDSLVSLKVSKQLEPVVELLNSNVLNELPFDLFGIEPGYFLEVMANAPAKLSAFISTIIEIGRNYDLRVEQFYFSVLRTYQAMHDTYFDELEQQADAFLTAHPLPNSPVTLPALLTGVLTDIYGCTVTPYDDSSQPALASLRSVYIPESNTLLINSRLSAEQTAFTLAREVGYRHLHLDNRPLESSMLAARSFDEVLNNFRASYFARAVLMPRAELMPILTKFVAQRTWQPDRLLSAIRRFGVTPEMFLLRTMSLLASGFGLNDLFFLRFDQPTEGQRFVLSKELHLSRLHTPHGVARDEHYCRRQVALTLLNDLRTQQATGSWNGQPACQAQITTYSSDGNAYLVLSIAKSSPPSTTNSSINIGLPITDQLRSVFAFLDDPAIPRTDVGETCERCPIPDCAVRAAAPVVLARNEQIDQIQQAIEGLRKN
ncbi:helix-turn-helix domain-containing protein [Fibrella forsythiae]|uniref:Helix-turn-helix domain-containing protein n=1 Tax=Fibrella forsythiae TaxID=2817061 RepID=A0ABS3JNK9_9BACT|nr:helix-turn-helix transcriptional regulator [Fibrella forsythiae]MBO0950492.1 helix-turn-helix domain-containing protein [Fibrella forsythiae]